MRQIWVDSDGVMVDFDRYVKENMSVAAQKNKKTFWSEMAIKRQPYRRMKATPYAKDLWAAIMLLVSHYKQQAPKILTALPLKDTMPSAEADKRWWYTHNPQIFADAPPEVVVGPYAEDKINHCTPGDILIDDKMDNCEAWAGAGGVAIHHTGDWRATARALQMLLSE